MVKFDCGDNIVVCVPFVANILDEFRDKRCNYCFNECSSLKNCSKCKKVAYCSKDCQEKDWKNVHKFKECKLLQLSRLENFDQHCLVRFILKLTFDPEARTKVWKLWDDKECKISDLVSHANDFKRTMPGLVSFLMKIMNEINNNLKQSFNMDDMWEFYGQFKINSIMLGQGYTQMEPVIATAVYVEFTAFEHSCRPNTTTLFIGSTLKIRAMNHIDTSVVQPTMSRISINCDRIERRMALEKTFYGVCNCQRCKSHDDKDIDFERLFRGLIIYDDRDLFNIEYWEKNIALLQRIYGECHPMIMPVMVRQWDAMVYHNLECTQGKISDKAAFQMRNLCAIIDNRFEITLGRDHPRFKDFEHYGILWNQLRWSSDQKEVFRQYWIANKTMRQTSIAVYQ